MPDHSKPAATAPWLRMPAVRRFVYRFGWRAYAIPFLALLSVIALVRPVTRAEADAASTHASTASGPVSAPTPSGSVAVPTPSGSVATPVSTPTSAAAAASAAPTSAAAAASAASTAQESVCASNAKPEFILVSLSQQHAWMCSGQQLVQQSVVTTGETDNGDQTPTGTWAVYSRQTDRTLTGPGYADHVKYWVPFNGDFGFHDASWQTMPFGSQGYHTQGSHGCVHLPTAMMAWFYNWVDVGATVTVTA
jgi:lipoprotein-anchoring transpeptidase ErfK/SrfK